MKFEFGDLYKFTVSLGVVLISLSVLTPWLFLKEPFDLFKTEAELKAVTAIAREAILYRQSSVSFILRFIPWFSSIGSLVGFILIYLGLKNWQKNQLLLDEQTKLEVEIKKQSLRDATKDEIETEAAKDFEHVVAEDTGNDVYRFNAFQYQYQQLEAIVAKRFSDIYSSYYEVRSNKMVAGIEIDLLLQGKSKLAKDIIIEVKSIRKGFNYAWLRESFLKNIYAKNIYSQITNRMPNTILLIITEIQGGIPEKYEPMLTKIHQEDFGRRGKDRVVMLPKDEFLALSSNELQEKLGVYA